MQRRNQPALERFNARARYQALLGTVLLSSLLSACTLFETRSEFGEIDHVSALMGRITAPPGWDGPVIVAATRRVGDEVVVAHRALLHEPGAYELLVPPGDYTVLAYADSDGDGDGVPDPTAPAGLLAGHVSTNGAHMIMGLDIAMTATAAELSESLPALPPASPTYSSQIGALADLDAAPFAADSGRRNYWTPIAGFHEFGGNVYFLEAYDSARTPVLFVHGASGSAQDFRYFYEHLDRSRYQAWVFQYPSGAPLDAMAHLLHWKLANLKLKYPIERLHIVAHSMGGLVVQRFLADHAAHFPEVEHFVTIATPWHGDTRATFGVRHSPAVVASWRDLQPDGAFLNELFARPLPPSIKHSLLFGHRGGPSLLRPTSDGTVTLASQLRLEAQRRAHVVMGFDEDHTSILSSPRVLHAVASLLEGS